MKNTNPLALTTLTFGRIAGGGPGQSMTTAEAPMDGSEMTTMSPESPAVTESDAPFDATSPATPEVPEAAAADEDDTSVGVWIQNDVATLCNMPEPKFAFDSAAVKDGAEPHLDALVDCMESGGLKDKNLALVGHADARGAKGYNKGLGMRRAESIADYLTAHGVDDGRVRTSSKGEQEADPADGHADDRRVEIRVATN